MTREGNILETGRGAYDEELRKLENATQKKRGEFESDDIGVSKESLG